ncbi:unnamed protein product [Blepharisma stoltei]|uniref:Dicer-2 n=1 Tax=Blepharisma stoltei TaxID=1481888 RepID=A0AAU9JM69_9CILI|nr:unnamed protein product [Blepharisma stoltei]
MSSSNYSQNSHESDELDSPDFDDDLNIEKNHPRAYQLQVLDIARQKNIIAFLDTGTGKTFIAMNLIKETLGKSVFLAPNIALVHQQASYSKNFEIISIGLEGEIADRWDYQTWQEALERVQLIVITPQLFLNALRYGYLRLNQFSLMIFDECHHCNGNHPYMSIMKEFYHNSKYKPKVMGLTASPVIHGNLQQKGNLKDDLENLCLFLDCEFASIDRESVASIANKPIFVVKEVKIGQQVNFEFVLRSLENLPACEESTLLVTEINNYGLYLLNLLGRRGLFLYLRELCLRAENQSIKHEITKLINNRMDISERVKLLVNELKKHFEGKENSSQVIVLAERKITVWYLADLLNEIFSAEGSYEIKAGKLIGKTTGGGNFRTYRMKGRCQRETIEGFKNKDFNVLVATTIIEEGLDIPSCDLVIRFDGSSTNLRSYVQSKGRARDQNSTFMVLVEHGNKKDMEAQLNGFEDAISWLKTIADENFSKPVRKMPNPQYYENPETGAKVCIEWSVKFIKEFCKKYPTDQYTVLKPHYEYKYYRPGECTIPGVNSLRGGYLCTLKLPKLFKISPIRSSKLWPKENESKEDASLQAVGELFSAGLLNKHLRPTWAENSTEKEYPHDDPEIEFINKNGGRIRAKRSKEDFTSMTLMPQIFSLFTIRARQDAHLFLYKIQLNPVFPENCSLYIGILSSVEIPGEPFTVFPYNLFRYRGIDIKHDKSFHDPNESCGKCNLFPFTAMPVLLNLKTYTNEELLKIQTFHIIFNSILGMRYKNLAEKIRKNEKIGIFGNKEITEIPTCVIPLLGDEIDWETINNAIDFVKQPNDAKFDAVGKVIYTTHLHEFFVVYEEIKDGLDYEFEDQHRHRVWSVEEYYHTKYGLNLESSVVYIARKLGTFRQFDRPKLNPGKDHSRTAYIPHDLAQIFPIPAEYLLLGKFTPSILNKLNKIFLMINLKQEIDIPLPSTKIIEAITSTSALELSNYERLEILGDCVLKYLTSIYLYHINPGDPEGLLTKKRIEIISNHRLFKLALQLKIYRYMQVKPLNTKRWLAPGMNEIFNDDIEIPSSSDEENEKEACDELGWDKTLEEDGELYFKPSNTVVEISHKQLADCIEALIGAAYLEGGFELATQLLANFKLIDHPPAVIDYGKIEGEFTDIEFKIGYEFKNKDLFAEAMTHPSLMKGCDYQRLEFLGDAVIDLVVLEHLMIKNPEATPGLLSKMKTAGVNNRFFALLNFELGLYKHLKHDNADLAKDIKALVQAKERMELEGEIDMKKFPDPGLKVLADQIESLVGAVYLDSGSFEVCKDIIFKIMKNHIEHISNPKGIEEHPHSRLLMWAQKQKIGSVRIQRYKVENYRNPESSEFVTRVFLDEEFVSEGRDVSKLKSSEIAASSFFEKIRQKGIIREE